MRPEDWPDVCRILQAGIDDGDATFETAAPDWPEWDASHLRELRLVVVGAEDLATGWTAATAVSERCAYDGVVEVSVYVDPEHRGSGAGTRLLEAFLIESDAAGLWTVQAGVFPENEASIALHRKCGFRVVGVRERLGKQGDRWRDVVLLERRSPHIR
jgi:L-amino acid N-acyltransferase YncA